ncbi:MAG: RDD family protein [Candidatus Diapherotrites archaeon]
MNENNGKTPQAKYGGFLERLVALALDFIIVFGVLFILGISFAGIVNGLQNINPEIGEIAENVWEIIWPIVVILWLIFTQAYFIYFYKKTGQTYGKKWMNLKVVKTNGKKLSWKDATVRWIIEEFFLVVFKFVHLWIIFDSKKQGIHDKAAKTYVIKLPKEDYNK